MYTSSAKLTNAFLHVQDFAQNASVVDRNIGFGLYMDGSAFSFSGQYFGTLDHFTNVVSYDTFPLHSFNPEHLSAFPSGPKLVKAYRGPILGP